MTLNAVILGSTGSIGRNALEVVDNLEGVEVLGITANTSLDIFKEQIKKYRPRYAALACRDSFLNLKKDPASQIPSFILEGMEGICALAAMEEADVVINGLAGIAGLRPALKGLRAGKKMAIANKESIVMGWELMRKAVQRPGQLVPVDSEHSALYQLIGNEDRSSIRRLIITASGGAVYNKGPRELEKVNIKQCLNHPTWDMGMKITVDSATLMNKGLEVIEAHFLFEMALDSIDIMIHPQSVVHGMAEFRDGSVVAHMSPADMKIPIQYAITGPGRADSPAGRLGAEKFMNLKFSLPDNEKFPCPEIARAAAREGGMKNIMLCAADEAAVEAFSRGLIKFTMIGRFISEMLEYDLKGSLASAGQVCAAYDEAITLCRKKLKEGEKWK